MRTLCTPAPRARRGIAATMLAAAALLTACAVEPTPGIGRAGSPCGTHAVLYCELAPPNDSCQCFRHSDLREMMRALSRR